MSAGTYLHQNMVRSPHALNHVSLAAIVLTINGYPVRLRFGLAGTNYSRTRLFACRAKSKIYTIKKR